MEDGRGGGGGGRGGGPPVSLFYQLKGFPLPIQEVGGRRGRGEFVSPADLYNVAVSTAAVLHT